MELVQKAIDSLSKEKKPSEPFRIVAELNFGFWTSLFSARYEQHFTNRIIKNSFPHLKKEDRTRQKISERLSPIRRIRNRVFHYEPIWKNPNLQLRHQELLETIDWLCPHAAVLLKPMDNFDTVFKSGYSAFENRVQASSVLT